MGKLFKSIMEIGYPPVTAAGAPLSVKSLLPSFFLAAAPAWYLFTKRKNLILSSNARLIFKISLAMVLFVMESSQVRPRSRLYEKASFELESTVLLAHFSVNDAGYLVLYNVNRAIGWQKVLTRAADVALVLDMAKCVYFAFNPELSDMAIMLLLSVCRAGIFLLPSVWQIVRQIGGDISYILTASGVKHLWQSPFRLSPVDDIEELRADFDAELLVENFHRNWLRHTDPKPSRYSLFWATFWTLKWEFILICVVRSCYGIAALARPFAANRVLTVVGKLDPTLWEQYLAILLTAFTFFGTSIFQHMLSRLSHRYLLRTHTILSGEVLNKSLQVKTEENYNSILLQTNKDVQLILDYLPLWANSATGPIELGAGVTVLWNYIGPASLISFVFFFSMIGFLLTATTYLTETIVANIPTSKFTRLMDESTQACEQACRNRVSESIQIFLQAKGIKAIGSQNTMITYLRDLYKTEIAATKAMRRWQVIFCSWQDLATGFTPVAIFYAMVKWTGFGPNLPPNLLFATLTTASFLIDRMDATYSGLHRTSPILGSHDRIQEFLCKEELRVNRVDERPIQYNMIHSFMNYMPLPPSEAQLQPSGNIIPNTDQLQLFNASIILPGGIKPLLDNVSVSVPRRKLTVVIGITASGKSQFLKALLGESGSLEGQLFLEKDTSIAYCSQKVWLQYKTVKENILGIHPLNKSRYESVIEMCQLTADLIQLPHGDGTIISTEARNLSTSQQCKIALARSIYSSAPVLVLDDPFSVLDRQTGDAIFNTLFGEDGFLRREGRTVVLATRYRRYLGDADLAIILDGEGHVITREGGQHFPVNQEMMRTVKRIEYAAGHSLPVRTAVSASHPGQIPPAQEDMDQANIGLQYRHLLTALLQLTSRRSLLLLCLSMGCTGVHYTLVSGFAGVWLVGDMQSTAALAAILFMSILTAAFTAVAMGHVLLVFIPSLCWTAHEKFLDSMMSAQLSYLTAADYSETLRQLNDDITRLGRHFAMNLLKVMMFTFWVFTDAIVVAFIPGCLLPLALFFAGSFYLFRKYYLPACSQATQLQQDALKALLTHMREVSTGVDHIRAFGWQQYFKDRGFVLLNNWQVPYFQYLDAMRWLAFILESISASVVLFVAAAGIWRGSITPNQIGFVSLVLGSRIVKSTTMSEEWAIMTSNGASVMRLVDAFKNTLKEPDEVQERDGDGTLDIGNIELNRVTARYGRDESSRVVLDRASLQIAPGQKAMLVGNSGSGKSSILLSILRFLNHQGTIKVGDVDVSTIPLANLRTQISVMPPEPLSLPGTVEHNLLPWRLTGGVDKITNETIEQVLKHVYLRMHIHNSGGLQIPMEDLKLSEGQKTQFAMARLVFHHLHYENKIVLMDEPTGGLDDAMRLHLDQLIENYFEGSTVLTVSRDPESITHADVVFYLEEGEVRKAPSNQVVL